MVEQNPSNSHLLLRANITLHHRDAADEAVIFALEKQLFGPGRFVRAAYQLRRQLPTYGPTSFVAKNEVGDIAGSAGTSLIAISGRQGLLLGPLIIHPCYQNRGVGRVLVNQVVAAARQTDGSNGQTLEYVLLVGDCAYYSICGFKQVPLGHLKMCVPVDPARLLYVPLCEDRLLEGTVMPVR